MVLYLRDKDRKTYVDVEIYVKKREDGSGDYVELHSAVILNNYSQLLLSNLERSQEIISDFSELDELRGWLWENFLMSNNTGKEYHRVIDAVAEIMTKIGEKYSLFVIQD